MLREVRKVLLDADVNYKVVKQFIDNVQQKSLGKEVVTSIAPGQLIVKIIHDELVALLGTAKAEITISQTPPSVILIAGLQGSGKTTFAGKLAYLLKAKGRSPLLVAADVYRPAAIDQLIMLGAQIEVPVFSSRTDTAIDIAKNSIDHARKNARDTVIIDTAGRLHVDEEMMREVESIKSSVQPVMKCFCRVDSVLSRHRIHHEKNFMGVN